MNYKPAIVDAEEVKKIPLSTGKHTAVLLDNIRSSGMIVYRYVLFVIEEGVKEPCLFLAAEMSTASATPEQMMAGMWGQWEEAEKHGEISYALGVFSEKGHQNLGFSSEWSVRDVFEKSAIDAAENALAQEME